jgi:hypothetical protein
VVIVSFYPRSKAGLHRRGKNYGDNREFIKILQEAIEGRKVLQIFDQLKVVGDLKHRKDCRVEKLFPTHVPFFKRLKVEKTVQCLDNEFLTCGQEWVLVIREREYFGSDVSRDQNGTKTFG